MVVNEKFCEPDGRAAHCKWKLAHSQRGEIGNAADKRMHDRRANGETPAQTVEPWEPAKM